MNTRIGIAVIAFASTYGIVSGQIPRSGLNSGNHAASHAAAAQRANLEQQRRNAARARELKERVERQKIQQQASAIRAWQESEARQRQEIIDNVYSQFPRPIDSKNKIVNGELLDSERNGLEKEYEGKCLKVSRDFLLLQTFTEEPINEVATGSRPIHNYLGRVTEYRSTVSTIQVGTKKIPDMKYVVRNYPSKLNPAVGLTISFYAAKTGTTNVSGDVFTLLDCGLPDTVENRKKAGIPIPTAQQIADAEKEIANALKARAEKQKEVKRQAEEMAAAKQRAIDDKALKWNQEQADKGDAYGLFRMGERYRDGEGVEKDFSKAREYFERAVSAGSPTARNELSKIDQVPTDASTIQEEK